MLNSLKSKLASVSAACLVFSVSPSVAGAAAEDPKPSRPNILWIVSEDNNPFLGCYGDKLAKTPTLDALASEGILYEHCHTMPVCAPSRFSIITGMYPTSCGPANQMRAQGKIPTWLRGFPTFLREAGYFTSNNAKTDYNSPISVREAWNESRKTAHWRHREPGQPFFAVFNTEITHESCLHPERKKSDHVPRITDPKAVRIPAYQPDTPEFREDWAYYYDCMAKMDSHMAGLLQQLKDDGLYDDTIIFYFGDNGGILPRSKRFLYDTGTHVPLLVRFPKKYQHLAPAEPGSRVNGVVSFLDFAPTVLSLAGIQPKDYMAGFALAGQFRQPHAPYVYAARDRMDGTLDMSRTVKDEKFCYIKNYNPHLPYGIYEQYQFRAAAYQAWQRLHDQGKLTGLPAKFFEPKPAEELYETPNDRDEVHNLAGDPKYREALERMRGALRAHLLRTHDNGFLPESSPQQGYDNTRDLTKYPLEKILDVADLAIQRDAKNLSRFEGALAGNHEGLRYWGAMGCVMLAEKAKPAAQILKTHLKDPSPGVSLACAESLCQIGESAIALPVIENALQHGSLEVRTQAANILEHVGEIARPALPLMRTVLAEDLTTKQRGENYPNEMLGRAVQLLK
jgi:arylsulfatase A-like enzyme